MGINTCIYVIIRHDLVGTTNTLKAGDLVIYERLASFISPRAVADITSLCATPVWKLMQTAHDYRRIA